MKRRRLSDKQRLEVLAKHGAGICVADLYLKHQTSAVSLRQ